MRSYGADPDLKVLLVVSGDLLFDDDLGGLVDHHLETAAEMTFATRRVNRASRFGVLEVDADGRVTRAREKPRVPDDEEHVVSAGIYCLSPRAVAAIPAGTTFDFAEHLTPLLLQQGATGADLWPARLLERRRDAGGTARSQPGRPPGPARHQEGRRPPHPCRRRQHVRERPGDGRPGRNLPRPQRPARAGQDRRRRDRHGLRGHGGSGDISRVGHLRSAGLEPRAGRSSSAMKVLVLASLYSPMTGGAETYIRLLAEGLAAQGHKVAVITDGSRLPGEQARETLGGVELIRLSDFAGELDREDKVRWRRMQYAVLEEIADRLPWVPDLLHVNSHETLVLGSMIALEYDVPLVASLHEQKPDLLAFGRGRCKLAYSTLPVDAYLAGSAFYHRRAVDFGAPEDRLTLIYHGVELPDLSPQARERGRRRFGVAEGVPLVVCAARLDPRKGQDDLVPAFARVREQVPEARLILAGRVADYPYAQRVRALIEEHAARGGSGCRRGPDRRRHARRDGGRGRRHAALA